MPVAAGTLFQQLYNAVDAAIVGKFVGTNALAAVGGGVGNILNVMVGFFIAMTSGSAVIIAHYYGSGDTERVASACRTGFSFCNITGLIVSVLGIIFSRAMLTAMKTPAIVIDDSVLYLQLCFAAAWAVMVYNMGAGVLRASGDSRRPFFYLAASCGTNIVLDLVFVVVFKWGVFGAALATAISQFVDNFVFAVVVSVPLFGWSMVQVLVCSASAAVFELLMEVLFSGLGFKLSVVLKSQL